MVRNPSRDLSTGLRPGARKRRNHRWLSAASVALLVAALAWLGLPQAPVPSPALLVALAPARELPGGESGGWAIARLEPGAAEVEVVAGGFAALGPPSVSWDGRSALFAGRRAPRDPMEVWEVGLSGSAPRKVAGGGECRDPAYLPDGLIVYSRLLEEPGRPAALHALRPGGPSERITFGPARDLGAAVLPDGRIAFRRHLLPEGDTRPGPGRLFVVNPDGTQLELFSPPSPGASIEAGPWIAGERVVFAEESLAGEASGGPSQRLVSVSARSPLGEREALVVSGAADRSGIAAPRERFSSLCLEPGGGLVGASWVDSLGWRLRSLARARSRVPAVAAPLRLPGLEGKLQPAAVATAAARPRPLRLTSVLDEKKQTGTLLCLDVYSSRLAAVRRLERGAIHTLKAFSAGGDVLGGTRVEADGSFFIEVPANRPLHLELYRGPPGAEELVARDESGLWVRPNENRGCIGCHEDPELSPENRVPLGLAEGAEPVARNLGRAPSPLARKP